MDKRVDDGSIPKLCAEAPEMEDDADRIHAMKYEINFLRKLNTWELLNLPERRKVIKKAGV